MPKKKPNCKCPPHIQKICKHGKSTDCTNVTEIIQALTYEEERKIKPKKTIVPPKFKTKPFKPRHFKDTCVPMTPSMHTRLRYIGHCTPEPPRSEALTRGAYMNYDSGSSSDEESSGILVTTKKREKFKKRVRYFDLMPGDIMLTTPCPVVKHTASDKSIFNVPSPKVSGEVIAAKKATVKPGQVKPPVPAKSGFDLFKPHSGIVINRDKEFSPDVVHVPGKLPKSGKPHKPSKKCKCGICRRKFCKQKKHGKCQAMRKLRDGRRLKSSGKFTSGHNAPYSTQGVTDGKPRARGAQKHLADDDSACAIDDIPKPEHVHIPANLKRGTIQTHSLTVLPCTKEKRGEIHYGILTGSCNMYDSKFGGRSRGRQALTMSVMAYCLAFHYHPKQWTMKLIDNLVDAGDTWYLQCLDKVHDHSAVQGMCEVLPFGKKQTLILNRKKMQILLGEPDIVGYTMSLDPTVYNLCRGLKAFFQDHRAGILLSRVLKVVIWKDKVCYYVFDPAGRDSRAYSNFATGCAALINVANLESLAEVLLSRTVLEDQKFVLACLKVLKMADENTEEDFESDKELTQAEKAMMSYRILDQNCAIVNANMHLGDRCFEDAKFRQAVPVAVMAMTYAKISPPNTWFTKTLDKILRLGNKLYMDCLHPKVMIDMTIDNIPNEIIVGPYACEIIIYRERVKGQLFTTKECLLNIRSGLQEFFSHEYNSGILDFNNYSMAVWRQKDMFYLFDPYPRTRDGLRAFKAGRACCWMLLNPDTMAEVFTRNWDYLPATTQFYIHAFKVLKLTKKQPKMALVCTLSDEQLHGRSKVKRSALSASQGRGDGREVFHDVMPRPSLPDVKEKTVEPKVDEEHMGDIVSLVDSVQEDYIPPIPLKYKNMEPEPGIEKVVNLDSPTVSVTQVVPPWPKPRDKTNEPPEPDPDPEPTPPPTPPPPPVPEGGEEEEEAAEEEEDEETIKAKKEEAARKKAEEEEARRKAEELPPPLPPPPPSPQPELEEELVPLEVAEDEVPTVEPPVNVDRQILLTEDARYRFKLRQIRKKITPPLTDAQLEISPSEELQKPSNFKTLPDGTEIIRGSTAISEGSAIEVLPFAAIMAIVTSYKYSINTWTGGLVNFVVDTANKLHANKQEKFQTAPVHIIPKIGLGHQTYSANIDVVGEGATWQLEDVLRHKFLPKHDRGMITTATYSCAFFRKNGLYYLFDGSACNPMGLREEQSKQGKACFLRFKDLHHMVARILYNKDGPTEDQQFILSKILVRRLLVESRQKLPEDYDYATGASKSSKSRPSLVHREPKRTSIKSEEPKSATQVGYQLYNGVYRIEGTTALKDRKGSSEIKSCHFVCLMAMLMAAMHPIRTWDHLMIDTCIEKGLEIYAKATNTALCEKRVIKNVIMDGKFMNVNIKKILVINENPEKRLEQYLKAVMHRLRYVIIRYPQCSMVICQTDGYYHLFDPYPPPAEDDSKKDDKQKKKKDSKKETTDKKKDTKDSKSDVSVKEQKKSAPVASWTLYRTQEALARRFRKTIAGCTVDNPEFYTFEMTSIKTAPRHSALNYRLSPLFKPDENPNAPYLKRRRIRPLVDEKMYWLNIETVPWSRMNPTNDLEFERKTPRTLWKEWDIEFPGDLYSLWGTIHPLDAQFKESHRGKQYLATSVVAIAMTQTCSLSAWTSGFLDGIVVAGDTYHCASLAKLGNVKNHEITVNDLDSKFDMFPYSFTVKFENIIFGFVYNLLPDRFNLSKALDYFFEKETLGLLTSPGKNLAFGRLGRSYFMYDCQSYGAPVFSPGQGASYMLKCESLNRLVYCMALTLNIKRHGQQFHLFSVAVTTSEKTK